MLFTLSSSESATLSLLIIRMLSSTFLADLCTLKRKSNNCPLDSLRKRYPFQCDYQI